MKSYNWMCYIYIYVFICILTIYIYIHNIDIYLHMSSRRNYCKLFKTKGKSIFINVLWFDLIKLKIETKLSNR